MPRLLLSYDSAFLALLLAGLGDEPCNITHEHCVIHHIKKKPIASCDAVDYAADMMVILAWYKLLDDIADEGMGKAYVIKPMLAGAFKKAKKKWEPLCRQLEEGLAKLATLEKEKSPSIDATASAFGEIMGAILAGYPAAKKQEVALKIADNHLGRWIYLLDAWKDIESNIASGAYNPLLYHFSYSREESQLDFRNRIHTDVERNLMLYLAELAKTVDLLDTHENTSIVDNIIYLGLLRRTENALQENGKERKKKYGQSL